MSAANIFAFPNSRNNIYLICWGESRAPLAPHISLLRISFSLATLRNDIQNIISVWHTCSNVHVIYSTPHRGQKNNKTHIKLTQILRLIFELIKPHRESFQKTTFSKKNTIFVAFFSRCHDATQTNRAVMNRIIQVLTRLSLGWNAKFRSRWLALIFFCLLHPYTKKMFIDEANLLLVETIRIWSTLLHYRCCFYDWFWFSIW